MNGTELRQRLERLGRPFTELAPLVGLSIDGLNKQMNGSRRVRRQTEMLLEYVEVATARGGKLGRETKLTPRQQREARERLAAGETQCSVARGDNVSQATISRLTGQR